MLDVFGLLHRFRRIALAVTICPPGQGLLGISGKGGFL